MARSDGGRNWGMYAGSKSASLPGSLHINILWFFRWFVFGNCSFSCAGAFQMLCICGHFAPYVASVSFSKRADAFAASYLQLCGPLK
ncbi:unnamed protein product [Prunus brigantina]